MNACIENLESRCLMSAVVLSPTVMSDVSNLTNAALTAKADLQHYIPLLKTDLTVVHTALVGTGPHNAALAAKLRADETRAYQSYGAGVTTLAAAEMRAGQRLVTDEVRLLGHPDDAALTAKLSRDAVIFKSAGTAVLNRFGAAAAATSAEAAADLTEIVIANPSDTALSSAVTAVTTDGGAFVSAVKTGVQGIESDLTTLVNDLSTVS